MRRTTRTLSELVDDSKMAIRGALLLLVAAAMISYVSAQITNLPVLNITQGQPLPVLQEIQPDSEGWVTLNMLPAGIQVACARWASSTVFKCARC